MLVAAHNEELVIADTIRAASQLVDLTNIHIISDGSTDTTATVARAAGANVLELNPNRGKAGALAAGIEHFELCRRFAVVLLLDADTHLAPDYLVTGLPLFDDPGVVAVAGRARTIDDRGSATRLGRFLVAYRERLYVIVQLLMKFGQAAKWANAVTIVPGFASMYRTDALQHIDVRGAGLVIEDFNMTFEIHAKKLGRIEFHPSAAHRLHPGSGHVRRLSETGAAVDPRVLADGSSAPISPGRLLGGVGGLHRGADQQQSDVRPAHPRAGRLDAGGTPAGDRP